MRSYITDSSAGRVAHCLLGQMLYYYKNQGESHAEKNDKCDTNGSVTQSLESTRNFNHIPGQRPSEVKLIIL